jgi:molybdopterin/thiamine biosynthesis adenylyltransferase
MIDEKSRDALVEALRREGFIAHPSPDHIDFDGQLTVNNKSLEAKLRFKGASFTQAPQLFLPDPTSLGRFVIPHLDEKGELCVFDQNRYLFDPYRAAASCLGILQKATSDLEANCGKAAEGEIARELPQHFGGYTVATCFEQHDGPLTANEDRPDRHIMLAPADETTKRVRAYAVSVPAELTFTATQPRPTTLGEFLDWVDYWDKGAADRIVAQLAKGPSGVLDLICMVCASNGQVGFQLEDTALPRKLREVYAKMPWNTLAGLTQMRSVPIKRLQGRRCDLPYVLSRNGGEMGPLANHKALLVGCGAIGGYAALSLAQLGGGAGNGCLTLVDQDILRAPNTVRHILGMDSVGHEKAISLQQLIEKRLPGLNTAAIPDKVQSLGEEIMSYDLILDATGEHHIGEWLNRYALQRQETNQPAMFHTWIEGQGAAVRSFFNSAPQAGCFRCLHADLESKKGRYWVLKPEAQVETVQPCGDDAYVPYGPSAAMAAAALLNAHVESWAADKTIKHLLTQQLDFDVTRQVKPVSPSRLNACPACGGTT